LSKIRIGIVGYGNLGKGVEQAITRNPDMELVAVFTRRAPEKVAITTKSATVHNVNETVYMQSAIDVMILCGGSATDLPEQGPAYAALFNTIDSFDTHAKIPQYFANVDKAARKSGHVAIISVGWDPGMFSINRLYAEAILPKGIHYTFWGKGVSQGHSDAIRRIKGVKNAIQYTIPIEKALVAVRSGANPQLTTREKHRRECFVVVEEGADRDYIENTIKNMPDYFAENDTVVHFISEDELKKNHSKMNHGGFVLRTGQTGAGNKHVIEYSLKLDSNPEFTGNVLVCYARAAYRLSQRGETGAKTVFDIAPALLSPKSAVELLSGVL
jgi:diaminopimelate dehydrogenase